MQVFPTIPLVSRPVRPAAFDHRKRKDGVYSSTTPWLKVMNPDYTQHEGRQEMLTAFLERPIRAFRQLYTLSLTFLSLENCMGLLILSAVGLPFMAIVFFTILEAAFSTAGLWAVLSDAGLDLCRISIGIAGAMFLDVQIRTAAGTFAVAVLLLELILAAGAMLVEKRATQMGISRQST